MAKKVPRRNRENLAFAVQLASLWLLAQSGQLVPCEVAAFYSWLSRGGRRPLLASRSRLRQFTRQRERENRGKSDKCREQGERREKRPLERKKEEHASRSDPLSSPSISPLDLHALTPTLAPRFAPRSWSPISPPGRGAEDRDRENKTDKTREESACSGERACPLFLFPKVTGSGERVYLLSPFVLSPPLLSPPLLFAHLHSQCNMICIIKLHNITKKETTDK